MIGRKNGTGSRHNPKSKLRRLLLALGNEILKNIGSGNFGVAKLVRDKPTAELFVVKYIERGPKIDEHVQREIMNHPNIIRFKEVLLTPTHLAIVMEYAAGGSNEYAMLARFFFQQLISGLNLKLISPFSQQICHRDLKLENTLLDATSATLRQ
ncbi:hypothetical protein V6N11_014507 [Hibiscus sabdariffa]|uniref:non-specific serine/threonine protein kinase n=1 Tax=Hibiscus sabdariffa TaxID=183260 RepID=A0ABR2TP86_9ROSI